MFHLRQAYVPSVLRETPGVLVGAAPASVARVGADGGASGTTLLYVAVPAAVVGLGVFLLGGGLVWVAAGAVGGGGLGYVAWTQRSICIDDLPEPQRTQVKGAISREDVAALGTYSKQVLDSGWTCASKQIDEEVAKINFAAHQRVTAGIDDVPNPPREDWRKLLDRSTSDTDPGGDLIASLESARAEADRRGYSAVRDQLDAAAKSVRKTIRLVRITEASVAKTIADEVASATALASGGVAATDAQLSAFDGLASQLDSLGYVDAAAEVRNMRDVAKKPKETKPGDLGLLFADPIARLPKDIYSMVRAAYDSGDPQQLDDVAAAYLTGYPDAWKKVKGDAAAIRSKWVLPLDSVDFGDVAIETGVVWLSSPQYLWGVKTPWLPTGKLVADALWKRQYRTAANQLGMKFAVAPGSGIGVDSINAAYPLPS